MKTEKKIKTGASNSGGKASRPDPKAKIMVAAEEIFAKCGYMGATLDMIAEKAGISKQNLLYYYSSKKQLYQTILKEILESWLASMTLFQQQGEDPASILENYIRGKLEMSRTRPYASKVFAHELISGGGQISKYLTTRLRPQMENDIRLVQTWIAEEKMDPIDPMHMFITLWAATQTYADFSVQVEVLLGKRRLTGPDFKAAADFITHMVLKGTGIRKTDA